MAGTLTVSTLNNDTGVLATQNGMTGIVKAWMNYNASSQTLVASFNVSSVTYNSTGNYTMNFTTAMPNTNYAVVFGAQDTATGAEFLAGRQSGTKTTGAFQIQNWNYVGSAVNSSGVYVAVLSS